MVNKEIIIDNLLEKVVKRLVADTSSPQSIRSRPKCIRSPLTRNDNMNCLNNEEWSILKSKIDQMNEKPNDLSILFHIIHTQLTEFFYCTPVKKVNSLWPCEVNYRPSVHRYNYHNRIILEVSILDEKKQIVVEEKDKKSLSAQALESDMEPNVTGQMIDQSESSQQNFIETEERSDNLVGDFCYIVFGIFEQVAAYVAYDFERSEIPNFANDSSKPFDLFKLQKIHGVVCKALCNFDKCLEGKKFSSKEYSRHGVNPVFLKPLKRKIDLTGSPESSNVLETAELDSNKIISPLQKLKLLHAAMSNKPNESSKLIACIITHLKICYNCYTIYEEGKWPVLPDYDGEVIVFLFPKRMQTIEDVEVGYDTFKLSLLSNGKDYFAVFRLAINPTKMIVKKLSAKLIPTFAPDDEENDFVRLDNICKWLNEICEKFISKVAIGFWKSNTSSEISSASSSREDQSPGAS